MHYYPQTSFGWTTNLSAYKARPSFWPPAEISSQSVFLCIRLGQSHWVSHKYMSSMCLVTENANILRETKLLRPPGNRRLFFRCGRDEAWTANYFGLTWVCNLVYFHQVVRVWTHPGTSWRYYSAISRSSSPWWSVRHLEVEILRFYPDNKVVSHLSLALITARLNTRIGNRGLSAREMWSQRDQFLNTQIPIIDQDLILAQHELRQRNHSYSERAKYPCKTIPPEPELCVRDIVYIRCDLNKTKSRDRYLVVSIDYPWCNIRRFVGQQFRQSSYRVKISDCFKVPVISNPAMLAD